MSGSFVVTDGEEFIEIFAMPVPKKAAEKRVSFVAVVELLSDIKRRFGNLPVFLERAKPMAMGSRFAFNYGRDFEKLVIALSNLGFTVTQVEPSKWAREMHQGISDQFRPKAKSMVAVQKLYPRLVPKMPAKRNGALQDGPVDALLLAGYGLRKQAEYANCEDFF